MTTRVQIPTLGGVVAAIVVVVAAAAQRRNGKIATENGTVIGKGIEIGTGTDLDETLILVVEATLPQAVVVDVEEAD